MDSKGDFKFNDQGASVLATLRNNLLELFKGNFVKDGKFSIRDFIIKKGVNYYLLSMTSGKGK